MSTLPNGLFEVDLNTCSFRLDRRYDTALGLELGKSYLIADFLRSVTLVKKHPLLESVKDVEMFKRINYVHFELISNGAFYEIELMTRPIYNTRGDVVGLRGSWELATEPVELRPVAVLEASIGL